MTVSALFGGTDAAGHIGLWVTDGTAAGTVELSVAGAYARGLQPYDLTLLGTKVLFGGADASGNFNLWSTDGTPAGTTEITISNALNGALAPEDIVAAGPDAYFNGVNSNNARVLYRTDGTAAGTVQVPLVARGTGGTLPEATDPGDITPFGPGVLFDALDTSGYAGLWIAVNGGSEELVSGASWGGLYPSDITSIGTVALFRAIDSRGDYSLWVTDGTVGGTRDLTDLPSATAAQAEFAPDDITAVGGKAIMSADIAALPGGEYLSISDGSVDGSYNLFALNGVGGPLDITAFGQKALFNAPDNASPFLRSLWVTNGTSQGTQMILDTGTATPGGLNPTDITVSGGKALFSGVDSTGNRGLWVTNGTSAGTSELTAAGASASGLNPTGITVAGGYFLFNGMDASGNNGLWKSDGTSAGTTEIAASGTAATGLNPTDIVDPPSLAGLQVAADVAQFDTVAGTGLIQIPAGDTVVSGTGASFAPGGLVLGGTAGGQGAAVVIGAGALLANTGPFVVGGTGLGQLTIDTGASSTTTAVAAIAGPVGTQVSNTTKTGGIGVDAVNVVNTGTLFAAAGTFEVQGSVTGTGVLEIDAGGVLQLDGSVAAGQTVVFTANTGTLSIGNLAGFAATTIAGFTAGDIIALPGQAYVEPSYNAATGTLQLQDNNGNTLRTLTFTNKPAASAVLPALRLPIGAVIGKQTGSDGSSVTVAGTGSSWTIGGELDVGGAAAGGLTITGGATVTASQAQLGAAGGSGNVNLEGAGSTLSIVNDLTVNPNSVLTLGQGTTLTVVNNLDIANGAVLAQFGGIIDPNRFPNSGVVGPTGSTIAPVEVENAGTFFAQNGVYSIQTPIIDLGTLTGAGTLQIKDGGDLVLNAAVDTSQTVQFSTSSGTLEVGYVNGVATSPAIGSFHAASINGFAAGDTVVVDTLAPATFSTAGTTVSVISNGATLGTLTFNTAPAGAFVDSVQCFAAGTRIETPDGPVPVETLRAGDLVTTAAGDAEPIVWAGSRRVDCARHPHPETVWPVRIARGAFGGGKPRRALYLSPDHAVFVNNVLVPAKYLVNGSSIVQVKRAAATYHHVELPAHAVILAEGLPVESYLDTGQRTNFHGEGGAIRLFPNFAAWSGPREARLWQALGAAPLVMAGEALAAARAAVTVPEPARTRRLDRGAAKSRRRRAVG